LYFNILFVDHIGAKFILFLYCFSQRKFPSVRILAQDHRNDLFVNSIGLAMSLLSGRIKWWMDPVGAIIVALLILRSWTITAYGNYHFISFDDFNRTFFIPFKLMINLFFLEQIQLIVGKSADSGFLNRATYIGKKFKISV
jgi:hypothetical protein